MGAGNNKSLTHTTVMCVPLYVFITPSRMNHHAPTRTIVSEGCAARHAER